MSENNMMGQVMEQTAQQIEQGVQQFQENVQQVTEFQKSVYDSAVKLAQSFDYKKSMDELLEKQKNLIDGMKVMMNLTQEDLATDQLEKEEVFGIGKMRLFHYKPLVTGRKLSKTPTLISYALVNRQYMMDLQEDRSMIKAFLESGMDVYIIDWGYPTAEDMYMTMEDHIEWYLNDCVDFVRNACKVDKINLLGVCQGGTFSIIYSALHPEKIKNLITMVVPVDFSTNDGLLFRWGKDMNIDSLVDAYDGVVPGDTMNFTYLILKPINLMFNKYVALIDKMTDPKYMANFVRMERWTFDSPAQEGATLSQFIHNMYQDNKLIKNEFELDGKKVDLKKITMPVLCACAEKDHLVPLSASTPLIDAIGSKDKQFLSFATGHIGMYTSSKSQKMIAPQIIEWIQARS